MKGNPHIEIITERPALVAGEDQSIDVLIRIEAPEPGAATSRPPLNLAIVLDRSGSMGGEKILRAREAACYCVEQLLPTDRVAVVTFADNIELLLPSTRLTSKTEILEVFRRIKAGGSTALHEAWVRGGLQIGDHLQDGAVNRVLLITDGQANVGETNPATIVMQARECASRGVTTSTIGIGADFYEDLLMPMAEAGRGNAWHVQEAGDMARIFAAELQGLVTQFAHTVSLGLKPVDGVKVVEVLNDFERTNTGRLKLPNLAAGNPIEVVVRLAVSAPELGIEKGLLGLRLAWNRHTVNVEQAFPFREKVYQDLRMPAMLREHWETLSSDKRVVKSVELLMSARARKEAIRWMDQGNYMEAQSVLFQRENQMRGISASFRKDSEFNQDVVELERLREELNDPRDHAMTRKKAAYQAHYRDKSQRP